MAVTESAVTDPAVHDLDVADLPVGGLRMVRVNGRRIVVIRTSEGVFALDNACPHEGYGLVQGDVNDADGTLTCAWHNWKFRLGDGRCVLGEEDVRTYDVVERDGRATIDLTDPPQQDRRGELLESLRSAMAEGYGGWTARAVVRLLQASTDPAELVWEAVAWGAPRTEFGWGHSLASAVDCIDLVERYEADERAHPVVQAIAGVSETEIRRPVRPLADPMPASSLPADVPAAFRSAVEAERTADAEAILRGALDAGAERAVMLHSLLGAVSDHHLSFGHAAIYTQKAFHLLDRLGWDRAETVLPHLPIMYIVGTREDRVPYMRPFLRALDGVDLGALAERAAAPDAGWDGGPALRAALLGRDKGAPARVAVDALRAGAGVDKLLDEVVLGASERLLRYDPAVDFDLYEDFGWLDITHAITYAHAARWAWHEWPSAETVRLALWTAFQLHYSGRVEWARRRVAEHGEPRTPEIEGRTGDLVDAIADRRPDDAVAIAHGLDVEDAAAQLERAALLDGAGSFIVAAHVIKTSHAAAVEAERLGSPLPIAAAARFAAAPRLERFVARNVVRSIELMHGRGPAARGDD
jgi:nitrite reductase/ring-hydroxylating ferredoxin subunit